MFFSGFCLQGEETLFDPWLTRNPWSIAGFSLGAIEAFEYVVETSLRVELLQLFSPAFFQDQTEVFKRIQKREYSRDPEGYTKSFLANIASPSSYDMIPYFKQGTSCELEKLLEYVWDERKLQSIVDRGVHVEVYLGGSDTIINARNALDFFSQFGRVEYYKNFGHILKGRE